MTHQKTFPFSVTRTVQTVQNKERMTKSRRFGITHSVDVDILEAVAGHLGYQLILIDDDEIKLLAAEAHSPMMWADAFDRIQSRYTYYRKMYQ
jgi:hypothetical protein